MRDDVAVAVGTIKGAFILRDGEVEGPLFKGERVPAFAFDTRTTPARMLAGSTSDWWGSGVRTSDDGGRTWSDPEKRPLRFPDDAGASLGQIWQLQPSTSAEPDVVYAGVEPAALFRSDDRGETWTLVRSLWDHPHRAQWQPGFGGLGLHTILVDPRDPNRMVVAISAGGVYRSDDGGETWTARNASIPTGDDPTNFPEFGQCVHKVSRDGQDPDKLFMQNHGGLFRSDDHALTWNDIATDVPSDFGFPMVTHPRVGDTAYAIPLDPYHRCVPDAHCQVWRTQNGGTSWAPLADGLPQEGAYFTVLRDAFCHDGADPLGLYFGTRTGQVYASFDEGESWELLVEYLPAVLSVRAAIVD